MTDEGAGPPLGAALLEAQRRFPALAEVLDALAAPATAEELRDSDHALAAFRDRSPIPGRAAVGRYAVAGLPRPRAGGRPALAAIAVFALATGGVASTVAAVSMITSSGLHATTPSHQQVGPSVPGNPQGRSGDPGRSGSAAPGSSGAAATTGTASTTAPTTTSGQCPQSSGAGATPTDMPSNPPPSSGWPSDPPPSMGVEPPGGCPPPGGPQRQGGPATGSPPPQSPRPQSPPPQTPPPQTPPPPGGRQDSTLSMPPQQGQPPAGSDRPPGVSRDAGGWPHP